jgi:hypothetical protein
MGIWVESALLIVVAVVVTYSVERVRRGKRERFWDDWWLRLVEARPDYEGRHRA